VDLVDLVDRVVRGNRLMLAGFSET
jgi:hypothetical protein